MDNNQILLVDTVVSFLDSTLESLVEGVSRIPSTVISAMESEADNTFKLKIGSEFQEYLAMVTRWYLEQLEGSGSEYA